jgi:predicted  nucleic acid-binding Zn-ribbon protein
MPATEADIRRVIRDRAISRAANNRRQKSLFDDNKLFKETIAGKLDGLLESNSYYNFLRCGADDLVRRCTKCGDTRNFSYQCSLKWCPSCNWKIAKRRREIISLWAQKIQQPKHLVLTQKNFPILTRSRLREFGVALARLRRTTVCEKITGGCVSWEITNEGSGWHLHAHCLVDVAWLNMKELSRVWGKQVGQKFAIVKITDAREGSYLSEICKYVVEGSELAKWPAEQILEFVNAIKGKRFFMSFGSLRKLAPMIRAEIEANKQPSPTCECGCESFKYSDSLSEEVASITREVEAKQKQRAVVSHQPLFGVGDTSGKAIQPHFALRIPDKISSADSFRTHGELRNRRT